LPRSGSTLLAGILRQNPLFCAGMSSPVNSIFITLSKSMSGANEGSIFISDDQRRHILTTMLEAYYENVSQDRTIFDTNRGWCGVLSVLTELFPRSRVICCVRNTAWILDSVERHIQKNQVHPPKMFSYEPGGNVYTRVEILMKSGFVGASM